MQQNTFNIRIPHFVGFYETIFDFRNACDVYDEIESYKTEYGITFHEDDFLMDWQGYAECVANKFAFEIEKYLKGKNLVKKIDNIQLESPRFYNFTTDKIFADVEFVDDIEDKLKDFIAANWNELSERIADEHGKLGCFLSADLDDWIVGCFYENKYQAEYLSCLLGYYLYFDKNFDVEEIECNILEDLNVSEFCHLNESSEKKLETACFSEK